MTSRFRLSAGFSAVELLIALTLTGALAAIGVPITGTTLAEFRLSGDAHAMANAVALAKMRAAATFSTARLYVDFTGRSYHVDVLQRGTTTWSADGGNVELNSSTTMSFGIITSAPPNTQAAIAQAPACLDSAGHAIANTACVLFNSRGIPVDTAGAPTGAGALYLSGDPGVYGITVAAAGQVQLWRSPLKATPAWTLQ